MPTTSVDTTCPRCMQAIAPRAKRCPNCGEPISASSRRAVLVFGMIGVLSLAGVIALAVFLQPSAAETKGQPAQEKSSPAKKPPLN